MDESSHPRYRDNEDSRFYKTDRLSPEETWRALRDELSRVLMDAQRAFWRGQLEMDPERVRWWHGAIFARHFPHDGGRFRRERAFFGVVTDGGGMRQIEGSPPHVLRKDLTELCAAFNTGTAQLDRQGIGIAEQTRVVATLYAGILRVHPFADGNHRTAFDVRYPQGMENGSHPSNERRDVAQIARADGLVDATPESIRALADSAMLLSQGAHRAIDMKREANGTNLDVPATTAAAQD